MALPRLGTMFDYIDPNAVGGLFRGLENKIAPDNEKKRTLERMIQQDPTLMSKFANMTPAEREATIKGMGFKDYKNASSILEAGTGEQLQARYEKDAAVKSLTSEQQRQRTAKIAGVDTQEVLNDDVVTRQRNVKGLEADQINIDSDKKDIELKNQALKDNQSRLDDMEKALLKYPDLGQIDMKESAAKYVLGQLDPELLVRIKNSGAAAMFESYADLAKQRASLAGQKELAMLRTPAEQQMAVRMSVDDVDNAFRAYKLALDQTENFTGVKDMQNRMAAKTSDPVNGEAAYEEQKAKVLLELGTASQIYQAATIRHGNISSFFNPTGDKGKTGTAADRETTPLPTIATKDDSQEVKVRKLAAVFKTLSGTKKMQFRMEIGNNPNYTDAEKAIITGKSK